jgi:hypothetical protein
MFDANVKQKCIRIMSQIIHSFHQIIHLNEFIAKKGLKIYDQAEV